MAKLTRADLMSLERYAVERPTLRAAVIEHKRRRNVQVGPHMTWCFEDRTTMRYQILEMLRAERIVDSDGIQGELDAYNPLVPDGANWKATLLLEFTDPHARQLALGQLIGVEDRCWVQVDGQERVFAMADEDLERQNEEKTSAVHFLRFELSPGMLAAAKTAASIRVGVDHDNYRHEVDLLPETRNALRSDLDDEETT